MIAALLRAGLIALVAAAPAAAHEEHAHDTGPPEVPDALFDPPVPGTYELPPIQGVSDPILLDPTGTRAPLLGLRRGQCALVSFVYRDCPDAGGCPLVLAVLQRVDREVARRSDLAERVRIATVSFDPEHDPPERMAALERLLAPRSDWRFLTAGSDEEIAPVLREFGQDALRLVGPGGGATGIIRHVLKVFLVDDRQRVRNVYSAGFLDPRVLIADVETVLAAR